ncbi:YciI family protein [Nibricoccus sp. IMCC34717]|uniref:YciI family protein n=1 Tax=Nibricoccus sp. IMCC34717 TaxID=3034021 RepID=UPI00384F9DD2
MSSSSPAGSPFMLLFRNAGLESHAHLTPDQKTALAKQWNDWVERLASQGKLPHAHPLGLGGRIVSGSAGERVTDGPYAEAKEAIGGYFFLNVADLDEATAIAKQCPSLPLGMIVEVRPVVLQSEVLTDVQARPVKP